MFVQGFCQANPGQKAFLAQDLSFAAPPWYVIHARSKHEAKVELALRQKGVEIFLPRITVRSRRQDRRLFLQVPLFPSYLFVRTVLEPWAYYEIIKLPGVVRLLDINGCPGTVLQSRWMPSKPLWPATGPIIPGLIWGRAGKCVSWKAPLPAQSASS